MASPCSLARAYTLAPAPSNGDSHGSVILKGQNFLEPAGDPGVLGPESVAWRVHANPVSLGLGAVAAVILELAEPSVRAGVWDHPTFKMDPIGRRERTIGAAMAVTYGPRALAQKTFDRVTALHRRVAGLNHLGEPYQAMQQPLLVWVHVTAHWGFLQAYLRYVDPGLARSEQDRYYREVAAVGRGYGIEVDVPTSVAEVEACLAATRPRLYANDTVQEFLRIAADSAPTALQRALRRRLVHAAIGLLPIELREAVGLSGQPAPASPGLVRGIVMVAALIVRQGDGPAQQACRRMGVSTRCLVQRDAAVPATPARSA